MARTFTIGMLVALALLSAAGRASSRAWTAIRTVKSQEHLTKMRARPSRTGWAFLEPVVSVCGYLFQSAPCACSRLFLWHLADWWYVAVPRRRLRRLQWHAPLQWTSRQSHWQKRWTEILNKLLLYVAKLLWRPVLIGPSLTWKRACKSQRHCLCDIVITVCARLHTMHGPLRIHSRVYNVFFNRIDHCNWRRLCAQRDLCSNQENDVPVRHGNTGTSPRHGRTWGKVLQRMLRWSLQHGKRAKRWRLDCPSRFGCYPQCCLSHLNLPRAFFTIDGAGHMVRA